jgi:hypothetical protein
MVMAKRSLKVGHFYYQKMSMLDVYCVLKTYMDGNLKWVQLHNLKSDEIRYDLYDSFLGKTREVNERYWKSIQG